MQYVADAPDDSGGSLIIRDDIVEDFPQLLRIEVVGRQESLCGLRIAENGRQWLIQLVNQGSGALVGSGTPPDQQLAVTPPEMPLRHQRDNQHQLQGPTGNHQ
jgi:hypothetical protein